MTGSGKSSRTLTSLARSLWRDRRGASMVEFTLGLPIFIGIAMTGLETANYVAIHTRISQIALMVADNAGRVRVSIDESDIEEVMVGARTSGADIGLGRHGRLVLSALQPNGQTGANAGQWIRWQRCFGAKNVTSSFGVENAGATNASIANGMGPSSNRITAANGSSVMFVEVFYDYKPMIGDFLVGPRTLRYTAAYTVRERTAGYPTNLTNMATSNQRLCSRFSST